PLADRHRHRDDEPPRGTPQEQGYPEPQEARPSQLRALIALERKRDAPGSEHDGGAGGDAQPCETVGVPRSVLDRCHGSIPPSRRSSAARPAEQTLDCTTRRHGGPGPLRRGFGRPAMRLPPNNETRPAELEEAVRLELLDDGWNERHDQRLQFPVTDVPG